MEKLKNGDGVTFPQYRDRVTIYYTGQAIGGHKYDRDHRDRSDVMENKPYSFNIGVGQEIKGWDIAIPKMDLGSKWKIIVPSALAFGETGIPGYVNENSDIIFEIEILKINNKASERYAKDLEEKLTILKRKKIEKESKIYVNNKEL